MNKYLFVLTIALLGARYWFALPEYKVGERVLVRGRVSTEPVGYEYSQRINVAGMQAYVDIYPRIYYGDMVVMEGVIEGRGKLKEGVVIDHQRARGFVYKLRQNIVAFYKRNLPSRHGALVAGMVLGSREGISRDFWDNLVESGVVHVVVASGTNVVLVGGFLINLLVALMKRQKAVMVAIIGIWFYVFLSGFDAPLVRAAIMGSIAFSAQALGRMSSGMRALVISVIAMLLLKPLWIHDLGFVMSFAATASLMLFETKVSTLIRKAPQLIRKDLSTTLAAQVGVLPILVFVFGRYSLWSPIANTLVLWSVVPIMIIGGVAGVVGVLAPPIGGLLLLLVYPLTSWFIIVVNMFS